MKAVITVGISASGKSTFADAWVCQDQDNRVEINRDNIRRSIVEEKGGVFSWAKWNWSYEKKVTDIAYDQMADAMEKGKDVIVSDTNLNASRRHDLILSLQARGYEVTVKDFPITFEEAMKRDAARANGVGVSVLAKQWEQWVDYVRNKPHETNTDNPIDFPKVQFRKYEADIRYTKCILVDIDGTLAHANNRRGMFEWDKVGCDEVDEQVRFIVNNIPETVMVIVLSGRDGVCQPETRDWLIRNGIQYDHLIMRKAGDMRKDTVIKEEIFWEHIADKYNVLFAIDDRPSVCRMWRDLGLKVFQVGNPHIEF